LLLECAGQSCRLASGQTAVVGRAEDATIVSRNPRVSRHHLEVRHDGVEWEVVDTASSGGVFAQGRRVTRLPVHGTVAVMLAVSDGRDRPARARYRAEVVAADGYLDLAVLRISTDDRGNALAEGALRDLVDVELARSADVRSADPVWVVGFPGLAQSDAATY